LFVQALQLAKPMKLVKLGQIALDGTKVKANASKHKALSQEIARIHDCFPVGMTTFVYNRVDLAFVILQVLSHMLGWSMYGLVL